jgi:hypothetical protein
VPWEKRIFRAFMQQGKNVARSEYCGKRGRFKNLEINPGGRDGFGKKAYGLFRRIFGDKSQLATRRCIEK